MDCILKISGNYQFAPGMWQTEDPFFAGKALVDDEGGLLGYIETGGGQRYSIVGACATN